MSKIHLLDPHTINQIAAGEVIENPASVVKELLENAVDAGADDICVEIRGGGRQLIRISDNGCGMSSEDAALSLERHATSKIRLVEDLNSVATMGFRGEAVPSIASISKFMILTCDNNDMVGTMIVVDGGRVVENAQAARTKGTTIEVKNLFFNVPVRKKFQRSPSYDTAEIQKVVALQALAHPEVKFQLFSDQKTLLNTSNHQDLAGRVRDVLGRDFAQGTTRIKYEEGPYKIEGVVGFPNFTRQNRTGQYLFINKRAVVSPIIGYAIRDGYGTALPSNRHPVWVMEITMPGELVDVNVHPQKREVRIRQQQEMREALIHAVRGAMAGQRYQEEDSLDTGEVEYVVVKPTFMPPNDSSVEGISLPPIAEHPKNPVFKQQEAFSPSSIPSQQSQNFRVLTTIPRYIVVDDFKGEGLCLIDQKAAHSRVIFEKLSAGKKNVSVQSLLVPYTLELPPAEAQTLRAHTELLGEMGLAVRESGPNAFIIDSVPQIFGVHDVASLVQEIVHQIQEFHDASHIEKELAKQMARLASRYAVSSSKKLTLGEGQVLVDQLMRCFTPMQCPFGKPTMLKITSEELAEKFNG